MTPTTTKIVCAKSPPHFLWVLADRFDEAGRYVWFCSWCGARVKVVA